MSHNVAKPVVAGLSSHDNHCTAQQEPGDNTPTTTPILTGETVPPLDPSPVQQDTVLGATTSGGATATAAEIAMLQDKIDLTELD